jgi:hypothetical protein
MQNSNTIATGVQTVTDVENLFSSREFIQGSSKKRVKVTGVTLYKDAYICNLAAYSQAHLDKATDLIEEGKFQEAANKQFTINSRVNKDYLPSKGEIIEVVFGYLPNKEGVQTLYPISYNPIKVEESTKVKVSFGSKVTETISSPVEEKEFA